MPRGKHGNHRRGAAHYRWRGGNPTPDPVKRRAHAHASAAKYPERRRAREKVKDAVRRGDLSPVRECPCLDCGEPAQRYDHYRGYDFPMDVQPVCCRCDGKRSRLRGEHKRGGKTAKAGGRELDGRTWDDMPGETRQQSSIDE